MGPLTNERGEKLSQSDFGRDLGDTDLYGSIQSLRELLTEEGSFASSADVALDPDAAVKRGIPYYQKALDSLAYEFATAMNALNNTGSAWPAPATSSASAATPTTPRRWTRSPAR